VNAANGTHHWWCCTYTCPCIYPLGLTILQQLHTQRSPRPLPCATTPVVNVISATAAKKQADIVTLQGARLISFCFSSASSMSDHYHHRCVPLSVLCLRIVCGRVSVVVRRVVCALERVKCVQSTDLAVPRQYDEHMPILRSAHECSLLFDREWWMCCVLDTTAARLFAISQLKTKNGAENDTFQRR
jgi:hypothetical protein